METPEDSTPEQEEEGTQRAEGLSRGTSMETQIIETKQLRKDLDDVIQGIRVLSSQSEETIHARHYATNALMWLGMNLKRLGNPNPYPNSRDTSNTIVDKTAAGLKI